MGPIGIRILNNVPYTLELVGGPATKLKLEFLPFLTPFNRNNSPAREEYDETMDLVIKERGNQIQYIYLHTG